VCPHARLTPEGPSGDRDTAAPAARRDAHSGSSRETVAAARRARQAGALTAALTSLLWPPLAGRSSTQLVTRAREADQGLVALAGRLTHIAVLDALLVTVSRARPERTARHRELYRAIRAEHRP
jgi:DNA-binding MurR/RpiR family transcriptional regulator